MKAALAAAALVALLPACAGPERGTVTNREYHPSWIEYVAGKAGTTSCSGTGASQRCSTTPGTAGYTVMHPERWQLRLRNGNDEGWRDVGEIAYNRCTTGENYPECADDSQGDR